jgi:hypothetical protein
VGIIKTAQMKQALPLFFAIAILCILRLTNLSVRLSDTNIYFYTAYELLQGKMLYKDIFFTNLPLFPYISSFYLLISGKNILFYYFSSTLEISIISLLIYYLLYKKTHDTIVSLTASFLYLYSFMVLSTSEHQTGVFLASLFSVLSYLFFEKNKYIWSGIFLALAILTKAYFIPIIISFFVFLLIQKKYRESLRILIGFLSTLTVLLSPFIFFAPYTIYKDIIGYSLTRSAGVSKIDILWFLITKDCIFFVLLVFNLLNFRKNLLFSLISFFSVIFFFSYADPYYLYLNFLPPFLSLSLPIFFMFLQKRFSVQKMVLPTFVGIFLVYTFLTYYTSYRNLGTFTNIDTLTQAIDKIHPNVLYGVNDTAPALAFLANTPLLNNIIDTNTNIFRKGILHASTLTDNAINQKAVIITHGAYYPTYSINEPVLDEIIDKKQLLKKCILIQSQPIYTEGIGNRINLFSCH